MDIDTNLLANLKLSINRALLGEVIPSLRKVALEWVPNADTACIIFYHSGPISDNVEEHYSYIHTEVEADFIIEPKIDYKVVQCDYPASLPKEGYLIYQRKEPFVDPR